MPFYVDDGIIINVPSLLLPKLINTDAGSWAESSVAFLINRHKLAGMLISGMPLLWDLPYQTSFRGGANYKSVININDLNTEDDTLEINNLDKT